MRIYSPDGGRLYLNKSERLSFLSAANSQTPIDRMFCQLLHYTGARPTEALELTYDRVNIDKCEIILRSLKKRKTDNQGRIKQPHYRSLIVPKSFIESFDLVFNVRGKKNTKGVLFFDRCRTSYYRMIKDVMKQADVKGKMATGKGLRHGFAVAMITAKEPMPLHILSKAMGHYDSKVTEVYLQVVEEEKTEIFNNAWSSQE